MVEPALSDLILDSPGNYYNSSGVYERENIATPKLYPQNTVGPDDENIGIVASMDGDARKGMLHPLKTDHTKPGGGRQRRSRPNTPRHTASQSSQPTSVPAYQIPPFENENAHNPPTATYLAQPVHFQAASPYGQRSGFVGPYTISTQPSPMNVQQSPPAFAFQPTFHSMVLENSMMPPNIHASYQPMVQSRTAVYPFQRPSSEGGQSSQHSFSNTPSPSVFSNHPSSTPPTPHLSSSSGQSLMSQPYGNPGTFHYPSTLAVPAYSFSPQTYPPSSLYQPTYTSPTYGHHFPSQTENEPQVTWYYIPHQSYDPGSSYQSHYGVGYPQVGHSGGIENTYNSLGHASSSGQVARSSNQYKQSSSSSRFHDGQRSADSSPSDPGRSQHDPSTTSSVSAEGGHQTPNERPLVRRSFHPNPPAHRSEWVMWVGNVPSDATKDEIWRFFNAPADGHPEETGAKNGVVSVFPISRSNCAFINYRSIEDLHKAIKRFNGVPLRHNDSRCPRLVCRVRRTDDDLKAGVGYQRGVGMHTRWIKERRLWEAEHTPDGTPSSPKSAPASVSGSVSGSLARAVSNLSLSSDDDGHKVQPAHSSSSDSYSSTNSSFLAHYFPQRYFILKSLSQEDLDISVARGVWATQKHNEEILDQAFRTSKDVYLIFGVNKSREFYGYARMTGPVVRGEHNVQWAARVPHNPPTGSQASLPILSSGQQGTFLSPSDGHLVDESPLTFGGSSVLSKPPPLRHSAPALMGEGYHKPTLTTPTAKQQSLDQQKSYLKRGQSEHFALDSSAPGRAVRGNQDAPGRSDVYVSAPALDQVQEEEVDGAEVEEEIFDLTTPIIQPEEEVQRGEMTWGDTFAVEWLCTDRLSFTNTRNLRNPWNRDKEIKVSRDGTELEPSVGRRLLEDWHKAPEDHATPGAASSKPFGGGRRLAVGRSGYPFPIINGGADGVPDTGSPQM